MSCAGHLRELERWFDAPVRERGERYLREGRVGLRIVPLVRGPDSDPDASDLITGLVEGGALYETCVDRRGEWIRLSCSCPHFQQAGVLCKHLWATLMMIERHMPRVVAGVRALARLEPVNVKARMSLTKALLGRDLAVWSVEPVPVTPQLWVRAPVAHALTEGRVRVEVRFAYDEMVVRPLDARTRLVDRVGRRVVLRDAASERAHLETLRAEGFQPEVESQCPESDAESIVGRLPIRDLSGRLARLLKAGWYAIAQDGRLSQPRELRVSVTTGIDWFEIRGDATFSGGGRAGFDAVLDAIRSGRRWVPLDDGGYGLLPGAWLRRWCDAAALGEVTDDGTRLSGAQIGLLDATVSRADCAAESTDVGAATSIEVDAASKRARERLYGFCGVQPKAAPRGFRGELRDYQRMALGWARFLERLGFGGCLADDMGLGKTIQVLAILLSRKQRRKSKDDGAPRMSLVVVPRSLIFNWRREMRFFAPTLRVVDHTGSGRATDPTMLVQANTDTVLTTYGTLRRDVAWLEQVPFDYCVLDEAQAIKNSRSKTAQAARRLQARHRLALSGTPVENHLGELWSLFEFLNPGMLGSQEGFRRWLQRDQHSGRRRQTLAAMIRPFVLRRTKAEVAPELPPREEHQLLCPLGPRQRALYDRLRSAYCMKLMDKVGRGHMAANGMQVLEALLRLRQAACHAALVDPTLKRVPSAKLDMLFDKLREIRAHGHKALVFSQFVKLLGLVRDRLERESIRYAYLDGSTRNRHAVVDRFENDPFCWVFLISLKAGGLGLNLTAAEYVFLLDPWWNPAVEAQAVDRTHRIGQDNPVFAYHLVAEDTVEQKILELQEHKLVLAGDVIQSDRGFLSQLSADDLAMLLGWGLAHPDP